MGLLKIPSSVPLPFPSSIGNTKNHGSFHSVEKKNSTSHQNYVSLFVIGFFIVVHSFFRGFLHPKQKHRFFSTRPEDGRPSAFASSGGWLHASPSGSSPVGIEFSLLCSVSIMFLKTLYTNII